MKIIKLLGLGVLSLSLIGCGVSGGGGEETDPKLYHLTLSYSANVVSDTSFKQDGLIATYANGIDGDLPRDPEEIELLRKAGASQADIDKAGVRQSDGSYFFFNSDPMYLKAPDVEGYRFLGFYKKGSDILEYKYQLLDIEGSKHYSRWNMVQSDVELEARYEVLKYKVHYVAGDGSIGNQTIADGATYNALTDGEVRLNDAVAPSGAEFWRWYYKKDNPEDPNNTQTLVKCTTLPRIYDETVINLTTDGYAITLFADYVYDKEDVMFEYELLTDQTPEPTTRDVVIEKMQVVGNLLYVDGVQVDPEVNRYGVEVDDSSDIQVQYGSWFNVFIFAKNGYKPWKYSVNGGTYDSVYESHELSGAYELVFYKEDVKDNLTIKLQFVLDI